MPGIKSIERNREGSTSVGAIITMRVPSGAM